MTHNYKIIEIAPKTYEIDEFDCDSIFVLLGENKALVIDTGTGVGDLEDRRGKPNRRSSL